MQPTLESLLAQFDGTLPLAQAHTIPAAWYHDPGLAQAERRGVFGDTWQLVGRADQVAGPGSFFTCEAAGEPVLVVRDETGVLRAFHNVCRHRGARVVCEPGGCATRLRCRYHGWTYDLAGRLRGVPEFDGVADFRREDNGLAGVAVGVWGSLVWVHLGDDPPELAEWLAPLDRLDTRATLARFRWHARQEYRLACNWKVYVDNYLDGGYHVNTIHPDLAGVLDYAQYRTEIDGCASVQRSPLRPPQAAAGAGREGIGEVRSGSDAFYWWVFPNIMLNFYEAALDTNRVIPDGPDACRVVFDYYFTETDTEAAGAFIGRSMEVTHQVQVEDVGVCEDVQRGLHSRSFQAGRYSVRREAGVYHFHQLLARRLRGSCP
jgi:choline monooxygenase